ncbi:uncharacterized protein B0I36DRAFT_354974 [Microdochium trichocladiopsis]|uniref:Uncharacterized protein n=1 Tax=Microdochium trichocladiopsis TaxID=1682393 RepID=A0A9P8XUE7_9PEZI|nr:uncharacterized protein B0I36DRAFT_354974 [Microdochium trichocladiopsis]KAH7016109.1 hypothetical protein B0I36DRAFT_354974 [Microdochium trichocladiopsis]
MSSRSRGRAQPTVAIPNVLRDGPHWHDPHSTCTSTGSGRLPTTTTREPWTGAHSVEDYLPCPLAVICLLLPNKLSASLTSRSPKSSTTSWTTVPLSRLEGTAKTSTAGQPSSSHRFSWPTTHSSPSSHFSLATLSPSDQFNSTLLEWLTTSIEDIANTDGFLDEEFPPEKLLAPGKSSQWLSRL